MYNDRNSGRAVATTGGGVSIGSLSGLLFIIFLVLKLCGVIDWPWLYVCLPLIVSAACAVFAIVVVALIVLISWIVTMRDRD